MTVAQCLEHDICVQAHDLTEVSERLEATLNAEAQYATSHGKKPFDGIAPAPKHYFDMWEKRTSFVSPSAADDGSRAELALCA